MNQTVGRRAFLQSLGTSVGTLGLASYLATTDAFGSAPRLHFAPRARHVIFLFMNGGPSHIDTFDPKPLIKHYEGQRPSQVELRTERTTGGLYPSPFAFVPGGQSGIPLASCCPTSASGWTTSA